MSFLRKLRNRLLALNHVVFSKKIENLSPECHFLGNLEIDYFVWNILYFQRKLKTEAHNVIFVKIYKLTTCFEPCCIFKGNWELKCAMSFLRIFRNRLLRLNHLVFSKKTENLSLESHFLGNLEIDYFVWNILYFRRKLRTEVRNVIFEEI